MRRAAAPTLSLSVQYASGRPAPARNRIRRWVHATLRAIDVPSARLTVRFVDEDEGRALNRRFRGTDHATNVLTFAYPAAPEAADADIVICLPVVEAEAAAQRKTVDVHGAHLLVHGTLHACGHDHENERDADAMEAIERSVLAGFGIVDPYRIDDDAPRPTE